MDRRHFLATSTAGALAALLSPRLAWSDDMPSNDLRHLAREAYIYLLPMVESYHSIHTYAVDRHDPEFKAPFNQIGNVARTFTPDDTGVVTPNSDTPYSFLMLDLRTEPLVVTLPPIEANRYYSMQLVDLYTHNLDYLGTRKDGNGGGRFLLAGPGWNGSAPKGVKRVVRFDTTLGFALIRTQLFSADDIDRVKAIQALYAVEPLSRYLGRTAPVAAPAIDWPPVDRVRVESDFWSLSAFLLSFAPPLPWETDLRASFERLGLRPGQPWPPASLSPADVKTITETGRATRKDIDKGVSALTSSVGLFGTPEKMKGRYWQRALAAKGGLYGNDLEETFYPIIPVDHQGQRLDTSKHRYVMRFPGGVLPPVNAFWSLTLYDSRTKLLVRNPIDRYLINSAMAPHLQREANGDIVIYIQKDSPGKNRESNWLPAADGPINLVMRLYLPKPEVLNGTWKRPPVVVAGQKASGGGKTRESCRLGGHDRFRHHHGSQIDRLQG